MLKLAIVKGVKNENGALVAPTEVRPEDVLFKGTDATDVNITGLEAGDTVVAGEYFVGKFNDAENKFVSPLVQVPEFTVAGEAKVDNVTAQATDDGASIKVGNQE